MLEFSLPNIDQRAGTDASSILCPFHLFRTPYHFLNSTTIFDLRQQLTFARTESDVLVKKRHPEDFEQHNEERLKRKSESRTLLSFFSVD